MRGLRWFSALLLALAVVAGAVLLLQRQTAAQLRDEIALLREGNRAVTRLRADNSRLAAAQPTAAQLEAMRADHLAVGRLRSEIEKLQKETDRQAREAERANAPLISSSEWKNAGYASPAAAVETFLWAASHHDLDAIASRLTTSPQARPAIDRFFELLPDALRTQYGSVERLLADYMTKDLPLGAMRLGVDVKPDEEWGLVIAHLEDKEGFAKDVPVGVVRSDDGWRLAIMPRAVQDFANQIGAQLAVSRKGG